MIVIFETAIVVQLLIYIDRHRQLASVQEPTIVVRLFIYSILGLEFRAFIWTLHLD